MVERSDIQARFHGAAFSLAAPVAVLLGTLALSSCSVPNYANPVEWYRAVTDENDSEEPEVVTVPAPPAQPDAEAAPGADKSSPVQDGIVALGRGDYNTALSEFRPLAEQGNALAQNQLGLMYEKGLIYPGYGFFTHEPDYEQAASWYRRAARKGLATAQYNLGRMYAEGHGVAHDYGEAAWWYLKAAVQGLPAAQYNLARGAVMGIWLWKTEGSFRLEFQLQPIK